MGRGYVQKSRTLSLPIDTDRFWVIDTGPFDSKRTDIAPFVGIRHEALEALTSELLEVPRDGANASIGANVGYILGIGYKTYAAPTAVANVLDVIDKAQEQLRPHLAIEAVPVIWKLTGVYDPGWRYRDIAIKLMTGRDADIPNALNEARAEFCEYDDEVCAQFRSFEKNVRNRMNGAVG